MDPVKNILDLPTEILHGIFSRVEDPKTIQHARLVSRRIHDVASAFLVQEASVRMTSKSLTDFEELSNHPMYSKSVTKVSINISYYDVDLGTDLSLFAQHCETSIYRNLELDDRSNVRMARSRGVFKMDEPLKNRLWTAVYRHTISALDRQEPDTESKTLKSLIRRLHTMYKQRCDDQDEIRRNNRHLERLYVALKKLPAFKHLILRDGSHPRYIREILEESDFVDIGLEREFLKHFDWALRPSTWCGFFETAYSTSPPVEMLGEFLSQIGHLGLRLSQIEVLLNAPANLKCLQLSAQQQEGVRKLVSSATCLSLKVDGWARKSSHAENNDRSRTEMLSLCSFSQPFFAAPCLTRMSVDFSKYPTFYEKPTVSLADILPLDMAYPHLSVLQLHYQPATTGEIECLVAHQHQTLVRFCWDIGWLLEGRWKETLDILRRLQTVTSVSLQYPKGDVFGTGRETHRPSFPSAAACDYILRKSNINPLSVENV